MEQVSQKKLTLLVEQFMSGNVANRTVQSEKSNVPNGTVQLTKVILLIMSMVLMEQCSQES